MFFFVPSAGFRSVRATHGVCEGDYYFEATVLPYSGDGAVRLGWSTRRSDAETPVGYSETSYGLRDRTGQFVHASRLFEYGERFGSGDVIGCRIHLPSVIERKVKAEIADADKAWLTYRFVSYLQGKEPPNTAVTLRGAYVEFFKNGRSLGVPSLFYASETSATKHAVCDNVFLAGIYYPTISLFRAGAVRVNFGPEFKHSLPSGSKPYVDVAPLPPEPVPPPVTEGPIGKAGPRQPSNPEPGDGGKADANGQGATLSPNLDGANPGLQKELATAVLDSGEKVLSGP